MVEILFVKLGFSPERRFCSSQKKDISVCRAGQPGCLEEVGDQLAKEDEKSWAALEDQKRSSKDL